MLKIKIIKLFLAALLTFLLTFCSYYIFKFTFFVTFFLQNYYKNKNVLRNLLHINDIWISFYGKPYIIKKLFKNKVLVIVCFYLFIVNTFFFCFFSTIFIDLFMKITDFSVENLIYIFSYNNFLFKFSVEVERVLYIFIFFVNFIFVFERAKYSFFILKYTKLSLLKRIILEIMFICDCIQAISSFFLAVLFIIDFIYFYFFGVFAIPLNNWILCIFYIKL